MFNSNNEITDDDDLFVPSASSSSNLAHLFGAQADLKSSLTYTPPKQPKPSDNPQSTQEKTTQAQKKLVCVKTITLSRFVDSNYSNVGKFGIAIIANQLNADLILYKTKQNILSTTKLSANFCCNHLNDTTFCFTDDQTLSWMVVFDSIKDKMEFVAELTKQGVEPQETNIKTDSFIPDSSSFNTKHRLLAEKPEEEQKRADILGRMSKLGMSILPGSESQSTSMSSITSKLSARVERELSESEPEEVIRTTKARKFRGRHSESAIETMDLVPKQPIPTHAATQFTPFPTNVQHVALGHQLMDPLNIYFAENRTHNSEVRMNLSQLGNKIDTLLTELRPHTFRGYHNSDSPDRDFERRVFELERKLENSQGNKGRGDLERQLEKQIKENAQNILKYDEVISKLREKNEFLSKSLQGDDTTELLGLKEKVKELEAVVASQKLQLENQGLCDANKSIDDLQKIIANQKLKLADFEAYNLQQEDKLDRLARKAKELDEYQSLQTALDESNNLNHPEQLQSSLDESNKKIEELEKVVENQKLKLADFAQIYSQQNQEEKLDRLARKAKELDEFQTLRTALDESNNQTEQLQSSLDESNKKIEELEKLVENQKLKLADFAQVYNKQNQEEKLDRLAREAAESDQKRRTEFLQVSLDQSNKKIEELEMLYQQVLDSRTKEEDIFADLVKESMNSMYQSVLTDSIDSTTNLDVRDLQKILQKHLKSTTFSIINQYSRLKDVDAGQGLSSVSPEFEVTV